MIDVKREYMYESQDCEIEEIAEQRHTGGGG
jgi:hypothetical protein